MTPHRGCILVVDDEDAARLYISRQLRQQNYTVAVAENGQQALEIARSQPFDLVLLDIVMPDMSGYRVLEQLQTDPDLCRIPVIMISSADDLDGVVRCIQLGAEDYLFKPLNPILLKARVGSCLERKRLQDQEQTYLAQLEAQKQFAKAAKRARKILLKNTSHELRVPLNIVSYSKTLQNNIQVQSDTKLIPDLKQQPIAWYRSTSTVKPAQASLVLVIDDDRTVRDQLIQHLNQIGLRVVTAWCGDEGLRLARELSPNLILLDILPHGESWRVLSALKSDRQLAEIPTILQALPPNSSTDTPDHHRGFVLGLCDYVTRPDEVQRLMLSMQHYLPRLNSIFSDHQILSVQRNLSIQQMLEQALKKPGWTLTTASSSQSALSQIATQHPALILLDLMLPNADSFQLVTQCAHKSGGRSLPIISMITRHLTANDMVTLDRSINLLQSNHSREELLEQVTSLTLMCLGEVSRGAERKSRNLG